MKLSKINSKIKVLEDSLMNLQIKDQELTNNLNLLQKEYDRDQTEYDKQQKVYEELREDLEEDPIFKKLNDDREALLKAVSNKENSNFYLYLFFFWCFLGIRFFVSDGNYTLLLFLGSFAVAMVYHHYHSRRLKNDPELQKLKENLNETQKEIRKYRKSKSPSFKRITKTTLKKSKKNIGLKSKEISEIQKEIKKTEQKLKSNISLRRFNKKYDKDDNQVLDVVQTSKVEKIILHQQNEIRLIEKKENRNYINDLFKISSFLVSYEQMLQLEFKDMQKLGDNTGINKEIQVFASNYENYQTLLRSLFMMIASLMQDNLFMYYKLRDAFDKLSVFDSNFEKELVSEIRSLKAVTSSLHDSIAEMTATLSADIWSLIDSVGDVQDQLFRQD